MIVSLTEAPSFAHFVDDVEPRLRRALVGHLPPDVVPDALSEAFAYAWEHWHDLQTLENPAGFLFRVAQSRARRRKSAMPPPPDPARLPHVEPKLVPAMRALTPMQRSSVWLIHGCGWTYREAAEALGISASAVGTHLERGMAHLRRALGVTTDA
jgi:DNA-directed RNA polymerase specialized sigma24 family protein